MSKYFTKGRMIVVSGRLQIRPWTDKDGNKRRSAEVVADNCYFGDSKKEGGDISNSAPTQKGDYDGDYANPPAYPQSNFELIEEDDSQFPF